MGGVGIITTAQLIVSKKLHLKKNKTREPHKDSWNTFKRFKPFNYVYLEYVAF